MQTDFDRDALNIDLDSIQRILVVRTSALGDILHVLPSLSALRELFPRAEISWLVEPLGSTVLQGHPYIDRIIVMDRKRWTRELRSPLHWRRMFREVTGLFRELRQKHFDLVIDFQCNHRSGFASWMTRGRYRLAFHAGDSREWGGVLAANIHAPPTPPLANKVVKNLNLVRLLGYRGDTPRARLGISEKDRAWARGIIADLPGDGPVVTLHPHVSAFGAIKRWPFEYYSDLSARLEEELDARILITWGPGEYDDAVRIGHGTVAPGTRELLRMAALIGESDLFIAADTGCLHMAAILGVPLVGLYGPKNPEVYAPYPLKGRIARSEVPCSPCSLRRCEHRICMSSLLPDAVFQMAREVLENETRQ